MREQYVVVKIYFELMSTLKHDIGRLTNVEIQQGMVCSLTLQER